MSVKTGKRAAILDAAITEFAERGYESASTNAIAERAGVAKGLVFHHFGDKEALFLACVDDVSLVIGRSFVDLFPPDAPRDLFGRLLVVMERKLAFLRDEPRASRFLLIGLADAPPAVKKKARALLEPGAQTLWKGILDGVDTSVLREGVSLQEAVELFGIVSAGLEKRNEALTDTPQKAKKFDVDAAVAHTKRVFELLRTGLYRHD